MTTVRGWGLGILLALAATMSTAASAGVGSRQAIGLPAYWSPETAAGMAMFQEVASATPTVGIVVVNGPHSAPPQPFSAATAEAIRALHRRGATVLGYVDTGYLGRTGMTTTRINAGSTGLVDWREQITTDALAWYRLYGRYGLAGVFLDQTLSECGPGHAYVDIYRAIGADVRRRQRSAVIAVNPGTSVSECYTRVADVILIFENTLDVYRRWTPPGWVHRHPESRFWHLVHGVENPDDMRAAIRLSRERNAGYVYVTNFAITPTSSPWMELPGRDYWNAELRAVGRRHRG